jgi:uncharacterized protein (TIGR02444 family)
VTANAPGNALWTFSLATYGRDGVAPICLRLQDEGGADVNLVLAALWLAVERRIALVPVDAKALVEETAAWRDGVVRPLREARRAAKTASVLDEGGRERFRTRLKAVELESEKIEQEFLYTFATRRWPAPGSAEEPGTARENLRVLLEVQCGRDFAVHAGEAIADLARHARAAAGDPPSAA